MVEKHIIAIDRMSCGVFSMKIMNHSNKPRYSSRQCFSVKYFENYNVVENAP
jgi:hypothetical protein